MKGAFLLLAFVALAAGCGEDERPALPQGSDPVQIDPADFSIEIDNPYWPMKPGSTWVYREGEQRVEVTVTNRTRTVMGVETRVVHDLVTEDGVPVEDTFDWYAQDADGNIWYFGEDTTEFEDGKPIGHEGAWEAGVDGAQPGIVLPADPEVGLTYRQETTPARPRTGRRSSASTSGSTCPRHVRGSSADGGHDAARRGSGRAQVLRPRRGARPRTEGEGGDRTRGADQLHGP